MKIFVAGATGVIGRSLVPILVEAGHDVIGTTRQHKGLSILSEQGAKGILLDVLDRGAVENALAEMAPEAVIHQLTALSNVNFAENARLRRVGTRNLVDAAHASGVRTFVAQSIAFAYEPGSEPALETTSLDLTASGSRAMTVNGVHSLETAVKEIPHHVILRYGTLYGPETWYTRNGLMASRLRAGDVKANDAVTSFVHVDDAAHAVRSALSWNPGIYNVVDDEPATASDWLPVFASLVGEPSPERTEGREGWERGAQNAKARSLGWRPIFATWRNGFTLT